MNGNTKVRIRLTKQLFESLSKQVIAEAKKMDMSGGAYTEAVKTPKTPKTSKSPEVKATNKMKEEGLGLDPSDKATDAKELGHMYASLAKGDEDDAPSDDDVEPIAETKNPEVDKLVKALVKHLTDKVFQHNDPKSTIGALKAALGRLEAGMSKDKKEPKQEEEGE